MKINDIVLEKWTAKYKRSINCSNPKGFSQRAHCQSRNKNEDLEPKDIHDLADNKNVKWDNDPDFMNKSKELTGKKHLDDMDQDELEIIKRFIAKK